MARTVAVKFYSLLRRQLGTPLLEIEADGLTVMDLLLLAEKKAGRPFLDELLDRKRGLLAGTMILLNGENVRLKSNLQTRVRGGDSVDLFSPAGGG